MFRNYNSELMQKWRKEVEDYLGFPLRIPEYARVVYRSEEYLAPVWDYCCTFYDNQNNLLCGLKSHDEFLFYDDRTGIPGDPDTWGSDEDWMGLFLPNNYAPVFKGFPWDFTLTFFDPQKRPTTQITARRTFQNDSRPTIHMAWYLNKWTYDSSGETNNSYTFKYFNWELP